MYYYLRALSVIKSVLGYITTQVAQAYLYIGTVIAAGVEKELSRIETIKENNINKAKQAVINAAMAVIALEGKVEDVVSREEDKAFSKTIKLKTKVN